MASFTEGFPPPQTHRPTITGNHFMASTGHYLATAAAVRILERGGNAIDAGVTAGMCINVLQPDMTNIGGVAPIVLYSANDKQVRSISGLGTWPKAVDREYFIRECGGEIPSGVHRCVMPAALDAWLTALKEFGTMTVADVVEAPRILAEEGFRAYNFFCKNIEAEAETLAGWPSTAETYLPNGRPPRVGERFVQPGLGNLFRMLVEAEEGAQHLGREAGIQAARDRFYKGDIAERTAAFFQEHGGFLTLSDLQEFSVEVETPASARYRDYTIYSCQPWCQGPVAPQALSILEGYDLKAMGHNSVDAIHVISQALNAAFADREHYYGDPRFVEVPVKGLHSPEYNATWRERIRMDRAFDGMPEPGNPWPFVPSGNGATPRAYEVPRAFAAPVEPDTSYLCIVDDEGNAFSATPSDGIGGSPVIPGLGFIVSGRGKQSWLEPDHPSRIEPGKRPRLTPSPGMILRDGELYAPYGTPGSDVQPQAMVQLAVNLIDFDMDPQAAIEAPRVASYSYPRSDHPHPYAPAALAAEARIPKEVLDGLADRGHKLQAWPEWTPRAGSLCTIVVDREQGMLLGAADARRLAYALGW
jgi:gamma-glutamyltranspeptidase / glutathione hydrolase